MEEMIKKLLIMLLGGGLVAGLSLPALAVSSVELHKLTASDAAAGDSFGYSVAISGSTALVGAFRNDDAGTRDYFGYSVAISGTTALVGAPLDDDAGTDSGSAYLFDVATGSQIAKLTADDAAFGDYFGDSVAISGTKALVGAPLDADAGPYSGSAYLFYVATGSQFAKLTDDAAAADQFGISVAISGTTALVGAFYDDDAGSKVRLGLPVPVLPISSCR